MFMFYRKRFYRLKREYCQVFCNCCCSDPQQYISGFTHQSHKSFCRLLFLREEELKWKVFKMSTQRHETLYCMYLKIKRGHSWLFTWKKILLGSPCSCEVTHRSYFSVEKCGNFVTWTVSIRNSRLQKSGSDELLYSSGVTHDVCSHNVSICMNQIVILS